MEGIDPFDLNDARLEERLGDFGAVLRDGTQLLQALSDLPTLDEAVGGLNGLDLQAAKTLSLVALLTYKWQASSPDEFRAWAYPDESNEAE